MFKFTKIIMLFAPIGVGAAIAETVGHMGIDVLKNLALMLATLYCALAAFILLVFVPIMLIARIPIIKFVKEYFRTGFDRFCYYQFRISLAKSDGENGKIWCSASDCFLCYANRL